MSLSPAPPSVASWLAVLRGRDWSQNQIVDVAEWVFADSNFKWLVRYAALNLGRGLASDAEDACQDFALQRFVKVVRRFDPARGPFEGFVAFCSGRWCRARARVLRRRADRVRPLDAVTLVRLRAGGGSAEDRLWRVERNRAARSIVGNVLATLKDQERKLIEMQFWNDTTVLDRAAAIGKKPSATKVTTHRLLRRLASVPDLRVARIAFEIGGTT